MLMNSLRKNSIALFIFLITILGVSHVAVASEITGTLSSNGDTTEQNQNLLLGEIDITSDGANGQTVAQNSGKIQGSVVQGREESTLMAAVKSSSWDTSTWLIPFAGVTLAIISFLLWSRKLI